MRKRLPASLLLAIAVGSMVSCTQQEAPKEQAQVFGEPASTIPWNTPQRWEGQAGGFNALRGEEDR